MFKNIRVPLFLVKIFNYEYWDWWFFYLPVLPYWLYLSWKLKSFTFFTAANPGIEAGGFFGESKIDILDKISEKYKPATLFISQEEDIENIGFLLAKNQISFPVIAKPNVGERGTDVEKIQSLEQLTKHLQVNSGNFIIQEFITFENELGVLYYRMPSEKKGKISSLTIKKFLSVTGNGKDSLATLINQSARARFQWKKLKVKFAEQLPEILPKNEVLLLEPIGNHCRGTAFLNGNHLINSQLEAIFDEVAGNIDGFYLGRFDLKVSNFDDLYAGKNIKIMELNGVSSDLGHIYDPNYQLLHAYRDFFRHLRVIAEISQQNIQNGIKPVPLKMLWQIARQHFRKPKSVPA
jgi:hypothetical protein